MHLKSFKNENNQNDNFFKIKYTAHKRSLQEILNSIYPTCN